MLFASQFIVCEVEEGCDKKHSDIHFDIPRIVRAREIEDRKEVIDEVILSRLRNSLKHRSVVEAVEGFLCCGNLVNGLEYHAGKGREDKYDNRLANALVVALFEFLAAHQIARQNHKQRYADAEQGAHRKGEEHQRTVQGISVAGRDAVDYSLNRGESCDWLAVEAVMQEEMNGKNRKHGDDAKDIHGAVALLQFFYIHSFSSLCQSSRYFSTIKRGRRLVSRYILPIYSPIIPIARSCRPPSAQIEQRVLAQPLTAAPIKKLTSE